MGTKNSIDVRIAILFEKFFRYYRKKRNFTPTPPSEDEIWNSLFNVADNFIHKLRDNLNIILHKESKLDKLIYFGFEQTELTFLSKYLRKDDIVLDVGANIGLYSLIASRLIGNKGKVYAFEPTPKIYERLVQNINLNKLNNIKPFNIALSNNNTIAKFNVSKDGYDAWNSFAQLQNHKNSDVIDVNTQKLDEFIVANKIENIKLVKIDVEGWEKFVLEGAEKLLLKQNPPIFLIEFTETNAFEAGYYCGELYDYLKAFGFEWYSYDQNTNTLLKEVKKLHYPYENLIAIKNYNDCFERINNT